VERLHDGYTPVFEKDYRVAVLHDPAELTGSGQPPAQVSIDGSELAAVPGATIAQRAAALEASATDAWYYDDTLNRSVIKLIDDQPLRLIQLTYPT
jgi:hypothetical protein